ncbi:MAG: ACT domain-containing protein [Acidimicrobiales bacterium]
MPMYLVRVVLDDRPGALGAVASRIGSVRGDVTAVQIVERGDGLAIDEFVVELPDDELLTLLVSEIEQVDGATVDEVRSLLDGTRDRRLDAYEAATTLVQERSPERVLEVLAGLVRRELDASWAAVVDAGDHTLISCDGRAPAAPWLAAHVSGALTDGRPEPEDIAMVALAAWDLILVIGRPGWRFGPRDHARLEALARLADARWADLAERDARTSHPSRAG